MTQIPSLIQNSKELKAKVLGFLTSKTVNSFLSRHHAPFFSLPCFCAIMMEIKPIRRR
ncbi:hypothetical protein HMPREF9176_1929 [Streptococcus downei F0415]|nr:hypothetical protein HMPREF9176_1929 [Streptococcus downei F0415]